MAADLSLSNQALALTGARSTILDINEVSSEAAACRMFYDPCRQAVLRTNDWAFARKQAVLTSLGTPLTPYLYRYTYPADCLAFRRIIPPAGAAAMDPALRRRFTVQSDGGAKVISSNVANAIGIYTYDVTAPALFDAIYSDAFVRYLASKITIPLTGNISLADELLAMAQNMIQNASSADGNEANVPLTPMQPITPGKQNGSQST